MNFQSAPAVEAISQPPRPRPAAAADEAEAAARLVAGAFRVSVTSLGLPGRGNARIALARHALMYLLHVVARRRYDEIAARLRRHRTSVRYACGRIEDLRDDPAFDARIARLEERLAAALARQCR